MQELTYHDLQFSLLRTPRPLLALMKEPQWAGKIFVGGGFLRSIVAGDPINDVDVFTPSAAEAEQLARELVVARLGRDGTHLSKVCLGDGSEPGFAKGTELLTESDEEIISRRIYRTPNALTLPIFQPAIQIIHRWSFKTGFDVADSFDFTCCCAAFWWGQESIVAPDLGWHSYCDDRFYPDVAAKRLVYRAPIRNEDAGGSMLRVLKYYQKGYRIPLDSLGAVMARMAMGLTLYHRLDEKETGRILTGMLREVDPAIDPQHLAHLPAFADRAAQDLGQEAANPELN